MLGAALAGAVVVAGLVSAAPAGAETTYDAWTMREDAVSPGVDTTYAWTGPATGLHLVAGVGNSVGASSDSSQGPWLDATFVPAAGQTLHAGETYRADAWYDGMTTAGMLVRHDGLVCGKNEDELFAGYLPANPATGWFHVSEIAYDDTGRPTRLAVTFEINCQNVGGPAGLEGTIAVNSTAPAAAVPDAPAVPASVTGLKAINVGPDGGGTNTTTLTWQNPPGLGDVTIDMIQSSNRSLFPALIGSYFTKQYRGRASSYVDGHVEFMDTRTYRVVPRGPSGRLGSPALLTVMGNRVDIPDTKQTIMIGQEAQFSGRLSESWDYVDPADVMKGPGLVGKVVLLCRQSSIDYVDGDCTVVDRTTTGADGRFSLSASPMANHLYNVVVPATGQMLGNSSRVINALVAPRTDLRAQESQPAGARVLVRRGGVIHFSTVRARRGSRGVVRLQRLDGHRWHTIATRNLGTSGPRRLAIGYREYTRGRHAYRVVKPGDSHHANGHSRTVYIRVG